MMGSTLNFRLSENIFPRTIDFKIVIVVRNEFSFINVSLNIIYRESI